MHSHAMTTAALLWLSIFSSAVDSWRYSDPSDWPLEWCQTGQRQSPIDIDPDSAVVLNSPPLKFDGFDRRIINLRFKNNGRQALVFVPRGVDARLSGGGMKAAYKLIQLQLHWGARNDSGSQHTMRGRSYPLELSMVHVKDERGVNATVAGAARYAVVSVFFELSTEDGPLDDLRRLLGKVREADDETRVPALILGDLLPVNRGFFIRYDGSLTTPDCEESAVWSLLVSEAQPVSAATLAGLRQLRDEDGAPLMPTRPTQPLNGREVLVRCATPDEDACREELAETVKDGAGRQNGPGPAVVCLLVLAALSVLLL